MLDRMETQMTPSFHGDPSFRIHVTAATPAAPLAILSVAGPLGIEPERVKDRLASLPSMQSEDFARPDATRLSALLKMLGFKVGLDPSFSLSVPDAAESATDLSIRTRVDADPQAVAQRLETVLGQPSSRVLADLLRPQGLVLHRLPAARLHALTRKLRRDKDLRLVASDADTAIYDGFRADRNAWPIDGLRRLGIGGCRFSRAVVAGVNAATARLLARGAPGRLVFVNREFQRFDLVVTAAHGIAAQELAGFLESRPGSGRQVVQPGLPVRAETDLSRRVAERFASDYASIGIEVRARLRGRLDGDCGFAG